MNATQLVDRMHAHLPDSPSSKALPSQPWDAHVAELDAVGIGSVVAVCDLHAGEREEYTLVPPDDADILQNRISSFSPLGRAIYGRGVGDIVRVEAPSGHVQIRIEAVRQLSADEHVRKSW